MGIPDGDLSPRGTGMGKKCPPQAFVGIPAGNFFCRGDGFGELKPDGEFPVAIPRHDDKISNSSNNNKERNLNIKLRWRLYREGNEPTNPSHCI
jgi:hypothetical protein